MSDSRALDSSKLEKLLNDMEASYSSMADNFEPGSLLAGRIEGSLKAVSVLRGRLERGDLDRDDWPPIKRTPVDKISPPVTSKVRKHDRATSWEAAWSQTPEKSQKLYRLIYELLRKLGPLTDEELHNALVDMDYPHTSSGLRTRRSELTAAGWVRSTNIRRTTQNDAPSTAWEHVPEETE